MAGASTDHAPLTAFRALAPITALAPLSTFGPAAGLLLLLGHDFGQGPLLQQLGHGAQGEAQHSHGGAQLQGVLDAAGGPQLVVTQPDPETAAFAITATAAATPAS